MSLKALAIALVAIALTTGNVFAQGDPRACGDFDFSEQKMQRVAAAEILQDLRSCDVRLVNAIVDGDIIWQRATFKHELGFSDVRIEGSTAFFDITFEGGVVFFETTFAGSTVFSNATFEGPAEFDRTTFEGGVVFFETTFAGSTVFSNITFARSTVFFDTTFEGPAEFDRTTFEGTADFRGTLFRERLSFFPIIHAEIWPPDSGRIRTDLTWNRVKGTSPGGENTIDMHGRWENFFTFSNKAADAEQVRTSRRRFQLRFWVRTVAGSFGIWWVLFTPIYYWRFRTDRRSSTLHHIGKLLLFSLDVISPSIRPWKFDWDMDGGLPVRRVAIITAVESAIGWILLGLGSAIAVAWLTA